MATGDQQISQSSQAWVPSPYKFSQPVRLFKANDPYYWEVDNLPIQQLEENILWLKDQISTSTFLSGVGRSEIAELRPFANGSSRTVFVQPGRYTSRINDAYGKGIGLKTLLTRANIGTGQRESWGFQYSDEELKAVLGDSVETVLLNNGLYDHLQHHNSEQASTLGLLVDWRHGYSYFTENNKGINVIQNIPKNKLALWKKTSNTTDLQQQATEFTRAYGAAIRTSVVNIPEQLSINIPEFDPDEHRSGTNFQPQVRVDLLFVYSHPIDADKTTIPSPTGQAPTEIFAPRLGLLKGAGVVNVSALEGNNVTDLTDVTGYIDGAEYDDIGGVEDFRFDMGAGVDESGSHKINSIPADNLQTLAGLDNVYSNFPSPDDVMNLAPLFAEKVEDGDNGYNLIGQTILPLAYVFSKRGKALIEPGDVVDIRPFLRTTELAYNERAGIAAASPPLSFANPAVGKKELRDTTFKLRNNLQTQVSPLVSDVTTLKQNGQVISKGMIYGGTKWGVEGALLAFLQRAGLTEAQTQAQALAGLQEHAHVPGNLTTLPLYPGWDINSSYFESAPGGGLGTKRNDRLHSAIIYGLGGSWQRVTEPAQLPNSIYDWTNELPGEELARWVNQAARTSGHNTAVLNTEGCLFVKKDIDFPAGFIEDFSDYEVRANLISCSLMSNSTGHGFVNENGAVFTGLSVQKRGRKGFTIIVALGHGSGSENNQWFGKPLDGGWTEEISFGIGTNNASYTTKTTTVEEYLRTQPTFSRVMVTPSEAVTVGVQGNSTGDPNDSGNTEYDSYHRQGHPEWETYNPVLVTYPTVEFSVIGYTQDGNTSNFFSETGSDPGSSVLNVNNA